MKILFLLLIISGLAIMPFMAIRKPWALRLWRRFKMVVLAYVLVIFVLAIYRLATNWDAIYG